MILTAGKTNVQKNLSGDAAGKNITQIVVGTSTTPVTAGDTSITGAVAVNLDTVLYPAADLAVYVATLSGSVPNMTIGEMGLLNSDGVLVHRKVVSPTVNHVSGLANTLKYQIKVI